jgi:hypothetical protein
MRASGTAGASVKTVSGWSQAAAVVLVAWFGLANCSSGQSVPVGAARTDAATRDTESTQAITHATVINPADGATKYRDTTIVIHGERIVSVGPSASVHIPSGAVVHDASGLFVIPGLWDAHVHLSQVGSSAASESTRSC